MATSLKASHPRLSCVKKVAKTSEMNRSPGLGFQDQGQDRWPRILF